jgi:hypothetical protein
MPEGLSCADEFNAAWPETVGPEARYPFSGGWRMKQPHKYQNRARRYRVLANGYAALKSRLARPAEGAARAFERMASAAEADARRDLAEVRSATGASPSR